MVILKIAKTETHPYISRYVIGRKIRNNKIQLDLQIGRSTQYIGVYNSVTDALAAAHTNEITPKPLTRRWG
jgi:hypothetical protein